MTHVFDPGGHEVPDAPKWLETVRQLGVAHVGSMGRILSSVEGVMVLAVIGNRHLSLASPSLSKGLPTYIDKPLACSLADAKQVLSLATKTGARYSASSLRFAGGDGDGQIIAGNHPRIDAFVSGQLPR